MHAKGRVERHYNTAFALSVRHLRAPIPPKALPWAMCCKAFSLLLPQKQPWSYGAFLQTLIQLSELC